MDDQPPRTLLERMTSGGISEDRALGMVDRGWVRVAGTPVTDPTARVPDDVAWVIHP